MPKSTVLVIGDTHFYQLSEFPSYYVSLCRKIANINNGIVKTRLDGDGYETVNVYRPNSKLFCVSRQAITLIKTNSRWAHV